MGLPKFLFYLLEPDGRSLSVRNGVVTSSAQLVHLADSPDGWQKQAIAWERDMKDSVGIVRTFTEPFGFVTDGAHILRKAFLSESLGRKIYLGVAMLNTEVDLNAKTFKQSYRKIYRGLIDATTFKSSPFKIEAKIAEGGVEAQYAANKNVAYEFSLDDGDAIVKNDGIYLEETGNFYIPALDTEVRAGHFIGATWTTTDGQAPGFGFTAERYGNVPGNYDYANGTNYFMQATQDVKGVRIKGTVRMRPNHAVGYYELGLWRSTQGQTTIVQVPTTTTDWIDIPFDFTIDVKENELFYLTGFKSGGSSLGIVSYDETTFTVSFKARYKTTYEKAYSLPYLFEKIVEKVTGQTGKSASLYLQSWANIKVSSGDGLRVLKGAKMKISLGDVMDIIRTVTAAGFGIENGKIICEDLPYFLNTAVVYPLGDVRNCAFSEIKENLFNTFKIGYPKIDTDEVNGKSSFNNTHTYKVSGIDVGSAERSLISPASACPFARELTRINLEGKDTTDSETDTQNFLSDAPFFRAFVDIITEPLGTGGAIGFDATGIDPDVFQPDSKITLVGAGVVSGTYTVIGAALTAGRMLVIVKELVQTGSFSGVVLTSNVCLLNRPAMNVTGVPDPASVYNVLLNPWFLMQRHMKWVNSVYWREAGTKLSFVTTDKNDTLAFDFGGRRVKQKEDFTIGTDRLFKNVQAAFDVPVLSGLADAMAKAPNTAFSFAWDGVTYTAFSSRIGLSLSDDKEQSFALIISPTQDLNPLIHG